jgi:hypothetical protein
MAFEVTIYKPNKDGKLEYHSRVSSDELSQRHWDKFNKDNTYSLQFKNSGAKYYKVNKQCIEDGCTKVVENARNKTCSIKCRIKRTQRKNRQYKKKKRCGG